MSSSKKTANYGLSQFTDGDKPMWVNDVNSDFAKLDVNLKSAADTAAAAKSAASSASSAASTAQTAANAAHTEAMTAQTTATKAQGSANTASLKVQPVTFSGAPGNATYNISGYVITSDNVTGMLIANIQFINLGAYDATAWSTTNLSTMSGWASTRECWGFAFENVGTVGDNAFQIGNNSSVITLRYSRNIHYPANSWHVGNIIVAVKKK